MDAVILSDITSKDSTWAVYTGLGMTALVDYLCFYWSTRRCPECRGFQDHSFSPLVTAEMRFRENQIHP